jgi:hypothetical protein
MLDNHIRRLCKRDGIPLEMLPTAGHPYGFRGQSAARFAAYVALADSVARNDIGLPPLLTERDLSAPVAIPEKVYQT